jgi:arylsulfatase A-like enzyme
LIPLSSRLAAFVIVCVVVALSACGKPATVENIVLVSIDTLRADHVSAYGYAQKTTPEIDALAARGVLFENAYAPSSWTTPSHASLFTGLLSSSHGAAQLNAPIRPDVPLLAEYLKEAGLATGAFVTHLLVADHLGFARGFDSFWFQENVPADKPTDAALEWIKSRRGQRFFVFLHYFDPHHPYLPPDAYVKTYDEFCRNERGDFGSLNKLFTGDREARDRVLACLIRRYDDEIRFVDAQIGRLVRQLRDDGLLDRTLLVITADHGEEFLDHGSVLHAITLYEEQLRVPLIFVGGPTNERKGQRLAARVRLIDVMPTLLELLQIKPKKAMQAASLLPLLRGEQGEDRDVIAETSDVGPDRMSLNAGRYKYIYAPNSTVFQQPMTDQLFNLADDPREQHDRKAAEPDTVKQMREQMIALAGYKWRRAWRVMWGGAGTAGARFGQLTTSGRFLYALKYLGVSSFDDEQTDAPLVHARTTADYRLQRSKQTITFSAQDQAQTNGLVAITDPDDAPLHAVLRWLRPDETDESRADREEFDLREAIDRLQPRTIGDKIFQIYSEPILTHPNPIPFHEVGYQNKLMPDLKKMLRSLGYF